jgi:hypothetical protein
MKNVFRGGRWLVVLAAALVSLPAWAKQAKQPPAPVPAEIGSAKTAFISNAGGLCDPYDPVSFGDGPNDAYRQFYAAMAKWGRYRLAASPANADLDFVIRFSCRPASYRSETTTFETKPFVAQLRLAIFDIRTRVLLWSITQPVKTAMLKSNRSKNFDYAMGRLLFHLRSIAPVPATPNPRAPNAG